MSYVASRTKKSLTKSSRTQDFWTFYPCINRGVRTEKSGLNFCSTSVTR